MAPRKSARMVSTMVDRMAFEEWFLRMISRVVPMIVSMV